MLSDRLQHAWQGSFYFYFLVASVSGPRNYLVMDIGDMYNKFQELLHLTLEEKGQIDLWGDRAMLISYRAFDR